MCSYKVRWNDNRICSGQQMLCNEHLQKLCNTQWTFTYLRFVGPLWICWSVWGLSRWLFHAEIQAGIGVSQLVCALVYVTVLSVGTRLKWQQLLRGSLFHGNDRNFKKVGVNSQFLWSLSLELATPTYTPPASTSPMVKPMVNGMRKYTPSTLLTDTAKSYGKGYDYGKGFY